MRARVHLELVEPRVACVAAEEPMLDRDDVARLKRHVELVGERANEEALQPPLQRVAARPLHVADLEAGRVDVVDELEQLARVDLPLPREGSSSARSIERCSFPVRAMRHESTRALVAGRPWLGDPPRVGVDQVEVFHRLGLCP